MPFYRFYDTVGHDAVRDAAELPNDEAAMMHAYGFLAAGACVDVWDEARHVAQLWGEADGAPRVVHRSNGAVIRIAATYFKPRPI